MAVVLGTNAGFVTVAPTADPAGTTTRIDLYEVAIKDTVPAGAGRITEIGWWCDNATEEINFEVGLYSHHIVNNKPDAQLFVNATNAKGTAAGWKKVTVNWAITEGTIYWIAIQVDETATITNIDRNTDSTRISFKAPAANLSNPWYGGSTETIWARAIYAVWKSSIAPVITDQSEDTVVSKGVAVNLFVTATGTEPLEYQWYKNGIELVGAILSTYVFYAEYLDAGIYTCTVTNDVDEVTSEPINVKVISNNYRYNLFELQLDLDRI